jgi:zinc protease
VKAYFDEVPGRPVKRPAPVIEPAITSTITDTAYDSNIEIPAIMIAYRTPGIREKDEKTMNIVSDILSGGASSRLLKKMVDEKKNAHSVGAFSLSGEDYSTYVMYGLPNADKTLEELIADIDEEIKKLQTELISDSELQKLRNRFESEFAEKHLTSLGIAESLASGYTYHRNTSHVNNELSEYLSVTKEDIRMAANKYLHPDQRVMLYYLPKKQ